MLDEIILDGTDTHDDGRARDTRSKTTDYQIIADAGFPRQDVPRANPPVRERHNQMNAMLKAADGTVSLFIHPRCKTLLRGLETVKLKPGAQYVSKRLRSL